jgi:hypothetical protein
VKIERRESVSLQASAGIAPDSRSMAPAEAEGGRLAAWRLKQW